MKNKKHLYNVLSFLFTLTGCCFFSVALKYAPDDVTPYLYAGAAVYTLLLIMLGYLEKKCRE